MKSTYNKKRYTILAVLIILALVPFFIFAPMLPINPAMVTGIEGEIGDSCQVIALWAAGRTVILGLVTLYAIFQKKFRVLKWLVSIIAMVHIYDAIINILVFPGTNIEDFGFVIGLVLFVVAHKLPRD